jgi:hypothetical protein
MRQLGISVIQKNYSQRDPQEQQSDGLQRMQEFHASSPNLECGGLAAAFTASPKEIASPNDACVAHCSRNFPDAFSGTAGESGTIICHAEK